MPNLSARTFHDKPTGKIQYYDDLAPDYREGPRFQAYLALTKLLFTPGRVLSLSDIKREQGESFNQRYILDAIEKLSVQEVGVSPLRWKYVEQEAPSLASAAWS